MKKLTIILEEDGDKVTHEHNTAEWDCDYNCYLQAMINALRGTGKVIPEEEDRV